VVAAGTSASSDGPIRAYQRPVAHDSNAPVPTRRNAAPERTTVAASAVNTVASVAAVAMAL